MKIGWMYVCHVHVGCKGLLLNEQEPLPGILSAIEEYHVTHLVSVPAILSALVQLPDSHAKTPLHAVGGLIRRSSNAVQHGRLRSLEYVVSSGDVLYWQDAQEILSHLPSEATFLNIYGCAEATADVLVYVLQSGQVPPDDKDSYADVEAGRAQGHNHRPGAVLSVPLGNPLGDCQVFLVPVIDNECRPPAAEGTLHPPTSSYDDCHFRLGISGECLAMGYWPDLLVHDCTSFGDLCTADGFVNVPLHVLQQVSFRCDQIPHGIALSGSCELSAMHTRIAYMHGGFLNFAMASASGK
jgi:acyl-CoA synthetase (AMP-forming)/AMP-acid ligase II